MSKFALPSEPDLPADDRDDADLDDAAFGIALDIDETEAPDDDDVSLQIPLDLATPSDVDDEPSVELLLGPLIQTTESDTADLGDTEPLADFDGRISNLEIDLPAGDDSEDKIFEFELPDNLPQLDGDENPEELPLASNESEAGLDDSEPATQALWVELEPRLEVPCEVVDVASNSVLCAGRKVFSLASEESSFVECDVGSLSCIAIAAVDRERSFLVSNSGWIRFVRFREGALRICGQLDARRALSHLRPSQIHLGGFGNNRVVLLAGDTLLEISGFDGTETDDVSLSMVTPGLRAKRVLAIPKHSERFWSLVEDGGRPALWRGVDGYERLDEIRLGDAGQWIGSGEEPQLAARASTVALSAFGRGLIVSCNDAQTFRRVPGCAGTTAIAIGLGVDARQARVFAALHSEVRDVTTVVEVEPLTGRATIIAQVRASASTDDESEGSSYVTALAFDDATETLVAVGEFGAKRWRSPQ